MKKRLISLIIVMTTLISFIPIIAQAATSGTCGDNLTWELDNGTLTISGTGDMTDYDCFYSPFFKRLSIEKIIIEDGISSIGSYAFQSCWSLTSISIPQSVTLIGSHAFESCNSLKSINIPQNVTTIQGCAFDQCSQLTKISIPKSVISIHGGVFEGCTSLQNIDVANENTSYSSEDGVLFNKNKSMIYCYPAGKKGTSYTIPASVTSIGFDAFGYSSLTSINIPSSVTSIGGNAFHYCTSLASISMPSSIIKIGGGAFQNCRSLTSISLPDNVTVIEDGVFCGCRMLDSINIPNGITSIDSQAFGRCSSLTNISIPNSVVSINNNAFRDCNMLKDVYYNGNKQQWEQISIGANNEYLLAATIHYLDSEEGNNSSSNDIDSNIINEVRKYTSSGEYDQFNAITLSELSHEEKFRRLNELFKNNGITDIREGIQYLSDTNSYRHDYLYLTTNDIYCAYNYWNWLYTTKSGLAARSALYTSGLIFNYEVFSYMNPAMYAESDYPGVKKNKTLLKKIMETSNDSTVSDVLDYSNKTAKFLKNLIKLNSIEQTDELDSLMDSILNASSDTERTKLQKQFAEKIAYQVKINGKDSIYLDSENFSKALGYSASILNFIGATADDITAMINLNNDIATYKKYEKFLTTIYTTPDVSWEMRLAAYQLLDDIDNGYFKRVQSLLGNVFELADGFIYTDKSKLQYFLESHGISESGSGLFMDALGTLRLATFISNIIIDTGDFVKQVAYTQGYAELSTLYSLKLEEDKQNFLANETAENAWTFFEDYTMLWNLRYQGEQQYLDMSSVKMYIFAKIKTYKYDEKEAAVKDNLEHLKECKFELAKGTTVPESIQYVKKSVVECPVDVYVYNSNDELIATLKDGVESDVTNEYGRFAVVRESYSGEYAKVICQSTDEELSITMSAIGDGLVDYRTNSVDSTDIKSIDKLLVKKEDNIEVTDNTYSINSADDAETFNGELISKETDSYIKVDSVVLSEDDLSIDYGESKSIGVTVYPNNATNTAVEWLSLDKDVATVKNGLITATGAGTTTIIAKACDSDEVECELTVNVNKLNPSFDIPNDITATYGQTLADISLPKGFAWSDDTQSVGNVGTNSFEATYTPGDTDNYNVVNVNIPIAVSPATITGVTITGYEGTYDKAAHGVTVEGADDYTVSYEYDGSTTSTSPTFTDCGEYTVKVTISKDNYTSIEQDAVVKINKADITGVTITGYSGKADGQAHGITVTGADDFTVTYQIDGTGEFTSEAPTFTEVGTHTVTVKVSGGNNYNELTQSVIVSLTEMEQVPNITVTPYGGTNGIVYDKNVHNAVTVNGTAGGDTITYKLNDGAETNTIPQITNAGTYNITVKVERNGYAPYITSVTAKITKAAAEITADYTQSTTYDGTVKNITASLNHDETTLSYSQSDIINAGTYTITVSAVETTNYLSASKTVTFTIQKADIKGVTITGYSGVADGNDYGVTVAGAEGYTVTYKSDDETEFTSIPPKFKEGTHNVILKVSGDNYNDLIIGPVTIAFTQPISTPINLNPIGKYENKLTIECSEDSIIITPTEIDLESVILYSAVYTAENTLKRVDVIIGRINENGNIVLPLSVPLLDEGDSYKFLLWDVKNSPIVKTFVI